MALRAEQIKQIKQDLKKSQTVLHDGGFYLVYRFGRWHLCTTGYTAGPNACKFIQTVAFLSNKRVNQYLFGYTEMPTIETYNQMFEGFAEEVEKKIYDSAEAYVSMIESGMLKAQTGITTDTMQVSEIGARDDQLLKGIQELMKGKDEMPSVILYFTK